MKENLGEVLHEIQMKLCAPKKNTNSFGKYKYRHYEDILEALKEIIPKGCFVVLTDQVELIGERYYVKATAGFHIGNPDAHQITCKGIEVSAYAREAFEKKGYDAAQITGSASSYARKLALSGLFCVDGDDSDIDSLDNNQDSLHTAFPKQQENSYETAHRVTEKEVEKLRAMLKSAEKEEINLLDHYKIYSLNELSRDEYTKTMAGLEKIIAKILGK